ncbi:MAG TPA: ABC transporter permease, partial [Savagea sp.]
MNVSFLELQQALIETTWMVGLSTLGAVAFGIPLGVVLFGTSPGLFWENRLIHRVLGTASNVVRSLPFVILLIVLIPLTKT